MTSVFRLISQPFVVLLSQLAKPVLQAIAQVPPLHEGVPLVPLQMVLHPPQLFVLEAVFVSHPFASFPSQFMKPVKQEPTAQVPVAQVGFAFARTHCTPQPPQLLVVFRLVSHPLLALPSQLWKPAAHVGVQTWFVHVVVPFEFEQAMPQPPQFDVVVTAVSHPLAALMSQLEKPLTQPPIWHVPLLQTAVAFG